MVIALNIALNILCSMIVLVIIVGGLLWVISEDHAQRTLRTDL